MQLQCESFIFDPRPEYPLVSTVKRYFVADPAVSEDVDALSLVFAHGTGFHKEHWEAVIEDITKLLTKGSEVKIREYWAFDAPNHGDAAILNEQVLDECGFLPIFRWGEYARSIHATLAGLGTGIPVDFSKRRLVGIGQSMGAVALALSNTFYPRIKFETMILIEPIIHSPDFQRYTVGRLEEGAEKRRDIWPSMEDAIKAFKSRPSWQDWDPRVLDAFMEHGLRPLPSLQYPDGQGVTLKCPKIHEAAMLRDRAGRVQIYFYLAHLVKRIPTHMWFGERDDHLPAEKKQEIIDVTGGLEAFASVGRIKGGGHLIVQTAPQNVAKVIYSAVIPQKQKAKL